ncbi:MAG: hypothetical protein R3247_01610 [Rhodothermales bacterium]|nr:hypothetical protein [Rhodothermales bacterium]
MLQTLLTRSMVRRSVAWLGALLVFTSGCTVPQGGDAYALMTPEQRAFADSLAQFTPASSAADLMAVLGQPYRNTPGKLYWRRPGAGENERVDVYLLDGRVGRIRYLSVSPMWVWQLEAQGGQLIPSP